jgi:adenosylhomocysteine nucleosidase
MARKVAKLGIMTAMESEFRLIANAFGFTTSRGIGPRSFLSASHNDLELTLVAARVGKVAAAVTASLLIQEFGVDAIVVVGVAGATDPTVRIGDIVIANRLVQHDMDLKGVLGYQRFDIPLLGAREMQSCDRLFAVATEAAKRTLASPSYVSGVRNFSPESPQMHAGVIGSGDVFVCDPGERESLSAAISDLKCVEMEGAAVAQVCVEHGVPFVVTRIISDEASGHAALDFGAFIEQAASIGSEVFVREFVRVLSSQK